MTNHSPGGLALAPPLRVLAYQATPKHDTAESYRGLKRKGRKEHLSPHISATDILRCRFCFVIFAAYKIVFENKPSPSHPTRESPVCRAFRPCAPVAEPSLFLHITFLGCRFWAVLNNSCLLAQPLPSHAWEGSALRTACNRFQYRAALQKCLLLFCNRALPLRNRAPIFWKRSPFFRKSLTVFLETLTVFWKSVSVFGCASACEGWVKVHARVAVVQLAVG